MLDGYVSGEFLYDYDKIRISDQIVKDSVPSFTEVEIYNIKNLLSDFYSLLYIYGGEAVIYLDDKKFYVPSNSLVVADRFSVIIPCAKNCYKARTIALDFKPELFGRVGDSNKDFSQMLKYVIGVFDDFKFNMPDGYFLHDKDGRIKYIFENSIKEYKERRIKYIDIIRDNIRAVLIEVARDLGCFTDKSIRSDLVQRIVDYCELHFSEKVTIKELSEMFNYSESYIRKICKKELGLSFTEYFRQKKIYNAAGMLSKYDYKVKEIAEKVGYNDVVYFTECFEKYIGMTPSEYRTRSRKSRKWFVGMDNLKGQKGLK